MFSVVSNFFLLSPIYTDMTHTSEFKTLYRMACGSADLVLTTGKDGFQEGIIAIPHVKPVELLHTCEMGVPPSVWERGW